MKAPFKLVMLTAAMLAACARKEEPVEVAAKAPVAIEVKTAPVELRRVNKSLSATGELLPDETVSMSFEIAGRLQSVKADFGQQVKRGAVLAELDPSEYRIQVERARALLAQSLARVGLSPNQVDTTPTTSPAIRQAEAQLADARSRYESAQKLIKTGDIANERYVELDNAMRSRQAALDAARDELRTLAANVQSIQAELKLAEKRLGDTVIGAPFDGAIAEKLVSAGQYIKENTAVLRLVKTDPLRLRADIPESSIGPIRAGSTLTFTTDAAPGQTFNATIREINPSLDEKSRTMTIEAKIANPNWRLRPGTFVQISLMTARGVEVVTMPKRALYNVAGLTKAFAIRDGKAVEVRVPPGIEGPDWIEAPAGALKPGDQVAINNLAALVDKAAVRAN